MPPYRGDEKLITLCCFVLNSKSQVSSTWHWVWEHGCQHLFPIRQSCIHSECLPDQISGRVTTYSLTSDEIGSVYKTHGFSQRVTQVYEDTKKMNLKKIIPEKSIDFAIVDACHDSDYVLNDFQKLMPFMAKGSIVMLHDTHPSMEKHYIDSYIACMYLRKLGFNIKYIKTSSWAIWFEDTGTVKQNSIKHALSSITNSLEKMIFGNSQNDLLRIRRYAKKNIS